MKKAKYVDGFVVPVPRKNIVAYKKMAMTMGKLFCKYGALNYVEAIADDVTKGKRTSYPRSVKLKSGEVVVTSFITFKSKGDRIKIWKKVMADPSMEKYMGGGRKMPFDGKRMFWGGFKPIVNV
jgi:uncharacterized protein YbaA (DUF1428 family)